jgi:hypothetical protein
MFNQPPDFKTLDDVKSYLLDVRNNLSLANMNPADIQTKAPTVNDVDSGKFAHAEIAGVPTLYYKTLNGVLYKFTGVAV